MNHLNSLILEGYVARKPELVEPLKGFKVCKFSVAVCRYIKETYENRSYLWFQSSAKKIHFMKD